MVAKNIKRIVIVNCCEVRFSKIIDHWLFEPVCGEKMCIELFSGQKWNMYVNNILAKKSETNPFELDAVFVTSDDEDLFDCLCGCIGEKGWFEDDGAFLNL